MSQDLSCPIHHLDHPPLPNLLLQFQHKGVNGQVHYLLKLSAEQKGKNQFHFLPTKNPKSLKNRKLLFPILFF